MLCRLEILRPRSSYFRPFLFLYTLSKPFTYVFFIATSSFVFARGWFLLHSTSSSSRAVIVNAAATLGILSCSVSQAGIALGQFSLLALGSILLLGVTHQNRTVFFGVLRLILLLFLAIKPLYFVPAAFLLLYQKHHAPVFVSVALVSILSFLTILAMGESSWESYLTGLTSFTSLDPIFAYKGAFKVERIPSLPTIIAYRLGGAQYSRFLPLLLLPCGVALFFWQKNTTSGAWSRVIWLMGGMLLLSSYVGLYDVLLLSLPFYVCSKNIDLNSARQLVVGIVLYLVTIVMLSSQEALYVCLSEIGVLIFSTIITFSKDMPDYNPLPNKAKS